MPYTMRGLGFIGTIAMFLVGGGIIAHTFHLSFIGIELIQNLILGLIAGLVLWALGYKIYAGFAFGVFATRNWDLAKSWVKGLLSK